MGNHLRDQQTYIRRFEDQCDRDVAAVTVDVVISRTREIRSGRNPRLQQGMLGEDSAVKNRNERSVFVGR
jgi:hypothetical protein